MSYDFVNFNFSHLFVIQECFCSLFNRNELLLFRKQDFHAQYVGIQARGKQVDPRNLNMSEACSGGIGSGLQVNTNLDHDRQPHDISVVMFLSSYDEGSRCMGINRTLTGFSQLKNLTRK